MLDDLRLDACIQGSSRYNLLEQPRLDSTGTRKRDQHPAGTQQFERQEIDVLVGTRGFFNLSGSGRKLRRVEDDHVEGARLVTEFSQQMKHIPFKSGVTFLIQLIEGNIFLA